jgi:hypothetical protein
MVNIQDKVNEFFESHPDATVVYESLGRLFSDREKAENLLRGVAGRVVMTHTKEGVQYERESDRMRAKIIAQENIVSDKYIAYHNATMADKEKAMADWLQAGEVLFHLNADYDKQIAEETKDESIAREEAQKNLLSALVPLTAEQLVAKIASQKLMIENSKAVAQKIRGLKKKEDAAAEIVRQEEILASLEQQLSKLSEDAQEPSEDLSEEEKQQVLKSLEGSETSPAANGQLNFPAESDDQDNESQDNTDEEHGGEAADNE